MQNNKYIQLELPFFFKSNQNSSNIIHFPHKKVLENIHQETEKKRQEAIKKGLEKSIKSIKWYYK